VHIHDLKRRAEEFRPRLEAGKQAAPDVRWFHGDILSNIDALVGLLKNEPEVFGAFRGGRVADIGAADGDLAFFLEAQGYRCDVIDFPDYNYNGLQGARALKSALKSEVEIHEIDLDGRFALPHQYDAVLFLGVLYHLRNPYYALETLAQQVRYCFLSTRVARWLNSGFWPWQKSTYVRHSPVAYLLDPDECNHDATNYWIFSEAGLERIVQRTGWIIRDQVHYGNTFNSNPRDTSRDERAYMLLESRLL
jgi:tRNA (mo5U34)-methyltransferase